MMNDIQDFKQWIQGRLSFDQLRLAANLDDHEIRPCRQLFTGDELIDVYRNHFVGIWDVVDDYCLLGVNPLRNFSIAMISREDNCDMGFKYLVTCFAIEIATYKILVDY